MNFKLTKCNIRILEPFAIFSILVGFGINIMIPLLIAYTGIGIDRKMEVVKGVWIASSFISLGYSLLVLRYLLFNNGFNRILYFIVAGIFVALIVVVPFI